jgi:TonB family protein
MPEPEPETVPVPVPVPVNVPPPPVARPIQGLSNDSFLQGSGTGLDVRAGHTTAVRATEETRTLDAPATQAPVALAAVTHPPKIKYKPTLDVPDAVRKGGLVGRVELLLSIDSEGLVTHIEVVESLSPEADEACVSALRKSRWKPADVEGQAVATMQVPYSCRFEQTPG